MPTPITGYFLRMVVDIGGGVQEIYFFSDALVNDFSRTLNDATKSTGKITVEQILFAEIISSQFANVSDSATYYFTRSTGTPSIGFVDGNDFGRAVQGVTQDFGQTPTSISYLSRLKYGGSLSPI